MSRAREALAAAEAQFTSCQEQREGMQTAVQDKEEEVGHLKNRSVLCIQPIRQWMAGSRTVKTYLRGQDVTYLDERGSPDSRCCIGASLLSPAVVHVLRNVQLACTGVALNSYWLCQCVATFNQVSYSSTVQSLAPLATCCPSYVCKSVSCSCMLMCAVLCWLQGAVRTADHCQTAAGAAAAAACKGTEAGHVWAAC